MFLFIARDPIIGLTEAYLTDDFPNKVNGKSQRYISCEKVFFPKSLIRTSCVFLLYQVGVGAYRGDDGKPYVLPCVRKAEAKIQSLDMNHEYAGMVGEPEFVDLGKLLLELEVRKNLEVFASTKPLLLSCFH